MTTMGSGINLLLAGNVDFMIGAHRFNEKRYKKLSIIARTDYIE